MSDITEVVAEAPRLASDIDVVLINGHSRPQGRTKLGAAIRPEARALPPRLKRMLLGRKLAGSDLLGVGLSGLRDEWAQISKAFDKPRHEVVEKTEHVVRHQDLPVAGGRRAYADGWHTKRSSDVAGNRFDSSLDNNRECSGLGDRQSVAANLCRLLI